ncbi:hypothetical protein BU17DRAFT_71024 [Hysterangium stoloniferum]|nr:hypothetical protein BU17DRAFT_71024 [Hysterangium stoloniferum]
MSMFHIPPPNKFDFYMDRTGSSPVQGKVNLPCTSFATASLFNYDPVPSDFIPFTLNGTTLWLLNPCKLHNHNPASVDPILTFYISDAKYYELSMPPAPMGEYKDLIYNPLKDCGLQLEAWTAKAMKCTEHIGLTCSWNFPKPHLKDQEDVELWTFKNLWGIDDGSDDFDNEYLDLVNHSLIGLYRFFRGMPDEPSSLVRIPVCEWTPFEPPKLDNFVTFAFAHLIPPVPGLQDITFAQYLRTLSLRDTSQPTGTNQKDLASAYSICCTLASNRQVSLNFGQAKTSPNEYLTCQAKGVGDQEWTLNGKVTISSEAVINQEWDYEKRK